MKRNGFTIVELVIVIAVVAVLAAVLIPTFSGIVKRACVSSDTQAVRNMNAVLAAEVADGAPPAGGYELIVALKENGFNDFSPKTSFYTFYWIKNENVIILADDAGNSVYPEGYADAIYDPDLWIDLESAAGMPPLPSAPSVEIEEPRKFTVTVSIPGGSSGIDFNVQPTATEGEPLNLSFVIPNESDLPYRYRIQKVSAVMENGEEKLKINVPGGSALGDSFAIGEAAVLNIPSVTGNVRINISLKEFCLVTLTGNEPSHMKKQGVSIWCQKGMRLHISEKRLQDWVLEEGYGITSAIARSGGAEIGEVFDYETNSIHARKLTIIDDIDIRLTTGPIIHSVQLAVKLLPDNSVLFSKDVTVGYDPVAKDVICTFDLSEVLADNKYELIIPVAKNEERNPRYTFNAVTCTVSITNIKHDFTLTYFVRQKEG